MASQFEQITAVEFTNSSITIKGSEGFKYISIHCASTSSVAGSVSGIDGTIGGINDSPLTIQPGDAINIGTTDREVDGITISAPLNCTMQVFGSKYTQIQ